MCSQSSGEIARVCVLSRFSPVQLFETLWTVAHQAPLSRGFSRQEYWSVLPGPLPGDPPNPGIEPESLMSPALSGGFFTTNATWEAQGNRTESKQHILQRRSATLPWQHLFMHSSCCPTYQSPSPATFPNSSLFSVSPILTHPMQGSSRNLLRSSFLVCPMILHVLTSLQSSKIFVSHYQHGNMQNTLLQGLNK